MIISLVKPSIIKEENGHLVPTQKGGISGQGTEKVSKDVEVEALPKVTNVVPTGYTIKTPIFQYAVALQRS